MHHLQNVLPTANDLNAKDTGQSSIKIAVFGSYYRGHAVLQALLNLASEQSGLTVVGVATDDPHKKFVSPSRRVWKYGYTDEEAGLVANLAIKHNVPVFNGRVKGDGNAFDEVYRSWAPDLCYMATFGPLIPEPIFSAPKHGFFNLHPSAPGEWPSFVGGNPFDAMIKARRTHAAITLHEVNENFDDGKFVAQTDPIEIPVGATVPMMHQITSPFAAQLVRTHVLDILNNL